MILQLLDLIQPTAFLNLGRKHQQVVLICRLHLQYVIDSIQHHDQSLRIIRRQQITERYQHTMLQHVRQLLSIPAQAQIFNAPGRFAPRRQNALAQQSYNLGYQIPVDHGLHLRLRARCYIWQEPNRLLFDLSIRVVEQRVKILQRVEVKHALRLLIGTGHNIPDGSQRSGHHFNLLVAQKRD